MIDKITEVAGGVIEGLKGQPLALAMIVINIIFLVFIFWILRTIADIRTAERADTKQIIEQLRVACTK